MHSGKHKLRLLKGNLLAVAWAILDTLVLFASPYRALQKRVLIVRLDSIGDFVLWLDAAKVLIESYHRQGYAVVLLGNKVWADWAKDMGLADEVWALDAPRFQKNYLYRAQWLIKIRKAGFSIAVQPTYTREPLVGDSIIHASGACERIGSVGSAINTSPGFISWSNRWFTHLIPASNDQLMELRRNAEFMRGLGFENFHARAPVIQTSNNDRWKELFQQPYAVIFVAASWEGKEWPIIKFIEICRRLKSMGLSLVIVGEKNSRDKSSEIIAGMHNEIVDLVGKTSLSDLAKVLHGASVVVSNDSSVAHIGAAVNVPVVCILGGGHFGRFLPYELEVINSNRKLPKPVFSEMECFGCKWHCIYARQRGESVKCISDVSVDMVWDAIILELKRYSA